MIPLTENRIPLMNLNRTIGALDDLESLIEYYSEDVPGPAYATIDCGPVRSFQVQIDRPFMVEALKKQRAKLIDYLATLGIDGNK